MRDWLLEIGVAAFFILSLGAILVYENAGPSFDWEACEAEQLRNAPAAWSYERILAYCRHKQKLTWRAALEQEDATR